MPNKALGQHWLKDRLILEAIADSALLSPDDVVLEIGPGLGTLTSVLLSRVERVVAVEYDSELARKLPGQFPGKQLEVVNADFLTFNLDSLPKGYKVVANVPYYITQKIVERLLQTTYTPETMVLLVQREVAEKLAAGPGKLTAVSAKLQLDYDVQLGTRVPKEYFLPPPKVDSQVAICKKHHVDKYVQNREQVYKMIEAGFSTPRKKLHTALAGGLGMSKDMATVLCTQASIDSNMRAQDLTVEQWVLLAGTYDKS